MCEFSVWLRWPDGRTEKIADGVHSVRQEERAIATLRGPLAEPRYILGTIQEIDVLKQTITLLPQNQL
jgi:hypothetical protein